MNIRVRNNQICYVEIFFKTISNALLICDRFGLISVLCDARTKPVEIYTVNLNLDGHDIAIYSSLVAPSQPLKVGSPSKMQRRWSSEMELTRMSEDGQRLLSNKVRSSNNNNSRVWYYDLSIVLCLGGGYNLVSDQFVLTRPGMN